MTWLALVLAMSGAQSTPLVLSDAVTVEGDMLHLSDVADLSALPEPLAQRAEGLIVARLSNSISTVSAREIAARARAALPGLSPWLPDGSDREIRVEQRKSQSATSVSAPTAAPASAPARPLVRTGEALKIRVVVGPVEIERSAKALQDGWAGRSIFVRTTEGTVLTVTLGGDAA